MNPILWLLFTIRHYVSPFIISNRCFAHGPTFRNAVVIDMSHPSRHRVPLLRDSFTNTDMGNPTVLRVQLLGNRRILRPGRRCSIFSAFIKGHRPAFPLHACFFFDSYYLEFQHPGFTLRKPQSCPDPAVKAGGWLLLLQRRILQSFGRQDI